MAQDPAPDPRRGEDPAPRESVPWSPPAVAAPDWLTGRDRDLVRAAMAEPGEPPVLDEEEFWYAEAERDLASLAELDAGAGAERAEQAALRARLVAAGLGGWAHLRGEPPLPGVHGGPAAGFGQGMCLDEAAPGSVLSMLADEASGDDRAFTDVTDDELLGIMSARQRLAARHAWELLTAVAEFIRRRPAPGCALAGAVRMPRCWSEHACAELAVQLAVTGYHADWLLGLAWDLAVKLPATSAALRDGIIDLSKARIVAGWCTPLTAAEAAAAEAIVFADPDVAEWTEPALRDRIARAAMQVNPDVMRKRREDAARDRRVEARPELSGNASLAGRELPPAAVLAASQRLTARARELRKLGVPGGMDELRALAFQESLGVLDPLADPGGAACETPDGAAVSGLDNGPDCRADDPDGTDGAGGVRDDGPDTTDAGRDDGPGSQSEDPGGDERGRPGDNDPDGGVDGGDGDDGGGDDGGGDDGGGDDGGGPGEDGPGGGNGGGPGGFPGPAPAGPGPGAGMVPGVVPPGFAARVNLTVPLVTLLGLAQRPGIMPRVGPVDPALVRDLAAAAAAHSATSWCVTVTGPTGRPVSHGCGRPAARGEDRRDETAEAPPGAAARDGPVSYDPGGGHGPPGAGTIRLDPGELTGTTGGGGGRDLVFALHPLAGPCDHAHQAAGHDPGALLKHLTGVLNATCTLPPCRRPASHSDYEHSQPFERGGRTCLCQAGPVCRQNHRDKQSPGWRVEAGGNRGEFRWTTPSGRTYLSRPTQYPD